MHDPANNGCPKNADPRNETCACAEADDRGGSAVGRGTIPLLRLTADEGWAAWKVLMSRPTEQVRKLRREVTNQILADHPGLEELGSSDVNCYAVSYLEARDLLVTADGWQWSKDYLCECGRHKLSCAKADWHGYPCGDRR